MNSKKVALFDVDKTLLDGYSGYYTTLRLIRCGAVRKRLIAKAILYKAFSKLHRGNVRRMYEIVLADTAGWSIERILEIGKECFEEDIRPRLYREALDLVARHAQEGHPRYFVTAGPYMTIKILGDYLGIHSEYAPGPVICNGILQKEIREPLPYGDGKLEVAKLIAAQEGVSLHDCYFYTDNIDDLVVLQAVGHPYAVNPDKKLAKIAKDAGWPILSFSECLGSDGREV